MAVIGQFDQVLTFIRDNADAPLVKLMMDRARMSVSDIQTYDDFVKINPLSKGELSAIQNENPPLNGLVDMNQVTKLFQSPGPIYNVKGQDFEHYRFYKALEMAGFTKNDIVINSFSSHISPAGEMFDDAIKKIGAIVFPMGPTGSEQAAEFAGLIGATAFIGTRTFLLKTLDQLGDQSKITKAYLIAEKLTEADRKMFKTNFNVSAFQGYGTAEFGLIGSEDSNVDGMIVDQDAIFLEVVEPLTGTPVDGSTMGEVVITFMNETTPFVRLATGDLSHVCEGKSDRIAGVFGRADSSVKVKGVFVHSWLFDGLAEELGCLLQLNVVTDDNGFDALVLTASKPLTEDIAMDVFKKTFGLKLSHILIDDTLEKTEIVDNRKRLEEK